MDILSEISLVTEHDVRTFRAFAQRSSDSPKLNQRSHQKCYPICFAIRRLFEKGRHFPRTRDQSIRILVACVQSYPQTEKFTGHMYYKHVIGFRDAFERYWEDVTDARERGDHSRGDRLADMVEFIDEQKKSSLLKDNTKLKFRIANALIDNRLLLGGAWPRGQIERKRHCRIGSCVSVSANTLEEITPIEHAQSARIEEPYMDDDGVSTAIQHADGATTRDKQKVTRFALTGFARTNVRTLADMNACSAVTYSDYLTHAAHSFADDEYALTWLAAFPGMDVSRPLAIRSSKDHMPFNDQLILDRSSHELLYNILRRRRRSDSATYEAAGIMRLPIPERVHYGLLQIAHAGNQHDTLDSCNRKAHAFSRKHLGLTATLNRLKATSRVLLAPRHFSELEFCAVSGRVVPALKGISAYYPHQVVPLASKFIQAYDTNLRELGIFGPSTDEITALSKGSQDELFCRPSPGILAVKELMDTICSTYIDSCAHLESLGLLATIEDLIGTLRLHEAGCYVLQQIALGIRPIGEIADFIAVSDSMGAMIRDKGSRLFSERSFSPLSHRHSKLLSCAHENRLLLHQFLTFSGLRLDFDEPNSSLACNFKSDPGDTAYKAVRMTNDFFRHKMPVVSKIVDRNYEPNWLRHVAAEYAAGMAPQWQLDEFFSHRRIGREAMSKWSTAGTSHFEPIKAHIDDLVSKLVAEPLLLPVPTYYHEHRSNIE